MQLPPLAFAIAEHIKAEGLAEGTRLPSRRLAEQFRVSRTPIERALRALEERGIVSSAGGGFAVRAAGAAISLDELGGRPSSEDEQLYLRIAEDHVAGQLPEKLSENELMRRYGVTRATILRILGRAAAEGWAERLPGRGWAFIPLLTSELAYEQIYRYRIVIEPAGILEPTFVLDRPAIEACRAEQIALFDGKGLGLSPVDVFEIGSRFHQTVLACSHNPLFQRGLEHADQMRRLVEYKKTAGSPHWLERCREHAQIAELLLDGDRPGAARMMREHLESGMREKTGRAVRRTHRAGRPAA